MQFREPCNFRRNFSSVGAMYCLFFFFSFKRIIIVLLYSYHVPHFIKKSFGNTSCKKSWDINPLKKLDVEIITVYFILFLFYEIGFIVVTIYDQLLYLLWNNIVYNSCILNMWNILYVGACSKLYVTWFDDEYFVTVGDPGHACNDTMSEFVLVILSFFMSYIFLLNSKM